MNDHRAPIAPRAGNARGAVVVLFVLILPVLLGFTAFALDLARLVTVRAELQNAADAAALAGARALVSGGGAAAYDWLSAESTANTAIALNESDDGLLAPSGVYAASTGYWNLTNPELGLRAPGESGAPVSGDQPAVEVVLRFSSNRNQPGGVRLFFAPVLGINRRDVSARAVAVVSPPGAAYTGSLFPMVISQCMYDNFWDAATARPKIDPATGQPYSLDIGSTYFSTCVSGQWSTFNTVQNDVPFVQGLINNGNPVDLAIGSNTYIQSGVKDALFNDVPTNKIVTIAVVNTVVTGSNQPIVAFAGFHLKGSIKIGGKSYIRGQFVANHVAAGTSPGSGTGAYYGAVTPPLLTF